MRSWAPAKAGARTGDEAAGTAGVDTVLDTTLYRRSGSRGLCRPACVRSCLHTPFIVVRQGVRRVVDKTVQSLLDYNFHIRDDERTGRGRAMKSFEDVISSSPDATEVRFISGATRTQDNTGMITLDVSELPAPVSSFDHVARSTASRESLVPAKPLWPFGLRARPHRQAS